MLKSQRNHYIAPARKLQAILSARVSASKKPLTTGRGGASLNADEHHALLRHLDLKRMMEDAERLHIYFRGHTGGFAYLKQIGAI
jgi:hypothetical protein